MAEIPRKPDVVKAPKPDVLAVNAEFLAMSAGVLAANSNDRQEVDREVGATLSEQKDEQFAADIDDTLRFQEAKRKPSINTVLLSFLPKQALVKGESGQLLVPKELLQDKQLAEDFDKMTDYKLGRLDRSKSIKRLEMKMASFMVDSEAIDKVSKSLTEQRFKADLVVSFLKDYKNLAPAELEKRVLWNKQLFDNQEKLKRGELNALEYAQVMDQSYEEGVNEFGDKECKKMWKQYKSGALNMSVASAEAELLGQVTETSNVEVSDVANAIDEAGSALASTGVKIDYSFIDGASVAADGFSLPLTIGKSEAGYAFYLKDATANDGKVGPIRAADLANELDKRHADNFFTVKVAKLLNNNEQVAKVPDKMMVGMVYRLLGDGAKRGFILGKRQRAVLENLAKVMVVEDSNYPTMYKRMVVLSEFVKKENNVNYLVKNLSKGTVRNVSEFISEGDAGENLLA